MSTDVFISYRGADRVLARKLEQRLRSRWGSRVYRDETSLMPGQSWSEQLDKAMKTAKVMLALIGPGWQIRQEGEDWVRKELLGAIEAGNPVLPVLVGDPDELSKKLGELPEAFALQAIRITDDLAGFDLHEVEKGLRHLGAFGDRRAGGIGTELSDVLPDRCAELTDQLLEGKSIIVSGASGYGRKALLNRMAEALEKRGGLVGGYGIELDSRSRQTHRVIASWVDALCKQIVELPSEIRSSQGVELVKAVLEYGPDLLARQVLRPELLLPLCDDDSDQKILDAAKRPTDRWAPFPPERLVSQSFSVIKHFAHAAGKGLTLFVDNIESIDGSSRNLVTRLLRMPPKNVSLVLATSAVRQTEGPESADVCVSRALDIPQHMFGKFASLSLHDDSLWGEPGAVMQRWLKRHKVRLASDVSDVITETNPYYALSSLWYLVDNGYLVEPKPKVESKLAEGTQYQANVASDDFVQWGPSNPDEPLIVPPRNKLLDHMIEEFVPVQFRSIIEAGALLGRRFLFSAAYAAAEPLESVDNQQSGSGALERWRDAADKCWGELERIDPDGSVIVCHYSADGERMISLAQEDLVAHLENQQKESTRLERHRLLAEYFRNPIGRDYSDRLDDLYRDASVAAAHFALAQQPREAADAERVAAESAEKALAYPEARRHYRRAIRLLTQLLAQKQYNATFELVDHEDLLVLANCLYRLGQMTRLANERSANKANQDDPEKYFKLSLKRLEELSQILQDKSLVARSPAKALKKSSRNLPEPNSIRHHIRLCESLSGWVNLDLAELYRHTNRDDSRRLLFDALRNAESARGEADSRWLLAATSARLAEKLVDDALQAKADNKPVRGHNLIIEAQFHIERVIGLAAVSPEEDSNLEESRSLAWTVLGNLFQFVEWQPHLADWAFRQMNRHRYAVSDLVDNITDRRLGVFLLSTHRGITDDRACRARDLLHRYQRWAVESGLSHEHAGAYINLALLELVELSPKGDLDLNVARGYVQKAIDCATDEVQASLLQNAHLLDALLIAIEKRDSSSIAYDHPATVDAFRKANLFDACDTATASGLLTTGWRILLLKLLRWCPVIEYKWIELERCLREPLLNDDSGWDRHRFFKSLVNDDEVNSAVKQAREYLRLAWQPNPEPASDQMIWSLLE
ncbi:MAG: TIR domain-containing protein, partial [Granulosicoccus sp.]